MNLEELFTKYWSQVTLLLLGIGYLIKRLLDIKARKKEINHNLFQQNKIDALGRFFSIYSKASQMWDHLSVFEILENKIAAKEIDKIIFPHLNNLEQSVFELKLYFDDDDHKLFENVSLNMLLINSKLCQLWMNFDEGYTIIQKSNDFGGFRGKVLRENRTIINELSTKVRLSFK